MNDSNISYSSSSDPNRSHLRLKMSAAARSDSVSMKIPSLLQKLPCRGSSSSPCPMPSSYGPSETSAVTHSALSVLENGFEDNGIGVKLPLVKLDEIDLDNITIAELQGLSVEDIDILKAKHLNKLSQTEREHVFQDIHGVPDFLEEAQNIPILDDLLKKFQDEIEDELVARKAKKRKNTKNRPSSPLSDAVTKQSALKEELGKLQEKLDNLVRQRNNLGTSMNGDGEFSSRKQLSAKNHALFGKLGDMGRFGSYQFGSNSSNMKNNFRPSAVPSSCFGGTSSLFSSTSAMVNTSGAQRDAFVLKDKDAFAYEQAVAQCRGRRRERNNSLFRPNMAGDKADYDDDLDEGRYIDVEHRDFRLSFLRAERFNTSKAAIRMIEYFEEKRKLFGIENLTTKIQIKDLDADSKRCFESGQIQLLPGRDRAGRAVIVETEKLAPNKGGHQDVNSILRAFWVLSSIALEDVETEKNGVVFVKYDIGGLHGASDEALRHQTCAWGNVLKALPLRIASMHWCVDNNTLRQAAYLSALMLGGSTFLRTRCHAGADMEVQNDLLSFGVPTDIFPVSMNGEMNIDRHLDFLRQRKKMEASTLLSKALALVEAPMFEDCAALDVSEDQMQEAVFGNKRARFSVNSFNQDQSDYHQNNIYTNDHMNMMPSPAFSDPFAFGNRNTMQVQASMRQQFEQRRQQQMLNGLQQQNLGLSMNMGMRQTSMMNSDLKSTTAFSKEPVLVPGELDILLGRGRGAQNHKGNIHYRQVVETFRARYENIPQKGAKTQLIREVVAVIYDNGGRFLKQDGLGRWIPVDPDVARDKVSHSFRNQKRLSIGGVASNSECLSSKKRSREE